jgi:hypothetical protein
MTEPVSELRKTYAKHLVECGCVLPQFQQRRPTVFHKFVVFSVVNEQGVVEPSLACCNNCGAVHRVTEIGVSKRLQKEESNLAPKISDYKFSVPEGMREILLSYKVPVDVWQEASFLIENEMWGRSVILTKEENQQTEKVSGKALQILGTTLFRVQPFTYSNLLGADEDEDE